MALLVVLLELLLPAQAHLFCLRLLVVMPCFGFPQLPVVLVLLLAVLVLLMPCVVALLVVLLELLLPAHFFCLCLLVVMPCFGFPQLPVVLVLLLAVLVLLMPCVVALLVVLLELLLPAHFFCLRLLVVMPCFGFPQLPVVLVLLLAVLVLLMPCVVALLVVLLELLLPAHLFCLRLLVVMPCFGFPQLPVVLVLLLAVLVLLMPCVVALLVVLLELLLPAHFFCLRLLVVMPCFGFPQLPVVLVLLLAVLVLLMPCVVALLVVLLELLLPAHFFCLCLLVVVPCFGLALPLRSLLADCPTGQFQEVACRATRAQLLCSRNLDKLDQANTSSNAPETQNRHLLNLLLLLLLLMPCVVALLAVVLPDLSLVLMPRHCFCFLLLLLLLMSRPVLLLLLGFGQALGLLSVLVPKIQAVAPHRGPPNSVRSAHQSPYSRKNRLVIYQ